MYHSLAHTTDNVVSRPGVVIIGGTMSGSIHLHGVAKSLNSRVVAVWVADDGRWRLAACTRNSPSMTAVHSRSLTEPFCPVGRE